MTEAALGHGGDSRLVWFPPLHDWSQDSDRSLGPRESLVGKASGGLLVVGQDLGDNHSPSPGTDYSWGGHPQVNRVPTCHSVGLIQLPSPEF